MKKLYNTQEEITTKIKENLLDFFPNIRKTQLKIIPFIIFGMIVAESSSAPKIAVKLKDDFCKVQTDSTIKRIRRFFTNKIFNPYEFYDKLIRFVIKKYKVKHKDKRIHIIFDHMFSHDNYTVFMLSLRIGTQGIPVWFRCFKGKSAEEAFDENLIKEAIEYASSLFSDDYELIFLADRWFNSTGILEFVDSLNHIYCIRLKGNIKVKYSDKKNRKIVKSASKLRSLKNRAVYYEDCEITDKNFKTNVVVSARKDLDEPWIIVTNGNIRNAIKDYGYRYGGVETIFKNQKSNGFRIESINNSSLKSFTTMYTMVCFAMIFLTTIGSDYTKNRNCYKNNKVETHKMYVKMGKKRIKSLFNIGLTIFNTAFNSCIYKRLTLKLILYDV